MPASLFSSLGLGVVDRASASQAAARRSLKRIVISFHPSDLMTGDPEDRQKGRTSAFVEQQSNGISGRRDCRRLQYCFRLTRFTSRCGFRNLYEFPGFHVVDIAVYRDVIGNQWVVSDTRDILYDALGVVGEC
jgi:hypothetical protein